MASVVAPIDRVRADIKSSAPSAQTLRHLRVLLGLDGTSGTNASQCDKAKPVRPQKVPKTTAIGRSAAKIKDPTQGTGRRVVRAQVVKAVPEVVGPTDCRKLATEVFNATLKQLGLAAKVAKESASQSEGDGPLVRLAPSQRPLQEQSPNRKRTTGPKDEKQVITETPRPVCSVLADCAISALQYLIDAEPGQDVKKGEQLAGLENASLILLDRTITLGLIIQADSQATHIYRHYWRPCPTSSPCPASQKPSGAQCLLGRPDAAKDKLLFGFTTAMQSQILRLVIQLGPSCISNDLINSLKLETIGSPAWLCLQGLKQNLQKAQQTGTQLRTISLAVSKLYSQAISSKTTSPSADDIYQLFCIAMSIKFASWGHLQHKLDAHTDFWRHFTSATKRYIISAPKVPSAGQEILHWIHCFQGLLRSAGQDSSVPSDLMEILLRVAGQLKCEQELYVLAGTKGADLDPTISLMSSCQVTSSRLNNYQQNTDLVLDSVNNTWNLLFKVSNLSVSDVERLLLPTVQLRKALLHVLRNILQSHQSNKSVATYQELRSSCYKLICQCVTFLFDHIRTVLTKTGQDLATDRRKTLLSTLVKNADAMLQLERCNPPRMSTSTDRSDDTLEYAVEMTKFLQTQIQDLENDESLSAALAQIRIRISQVYWTRYIKSVEGRANSRTQVQILSGSISILTSLSLTDEKSAFLGLKYQRLASCHADLHDFKAARHALGQSIEFDIKLGALRDAAEFALTGSSQLVWSRADSSCMSLGKSLAMFANVALAEAAGSEQSLELYDSNTSPPVQRAIVLERQISCLLEKSLDEKQLQHITSQLILLLALLDQPKYKVFRMRMVSSLVSTRLKTRTIIIGVVLMPQQIREILEPAPALSKTVYLLDFEPSVRTILKVQSDISTGQLNSSGLREHLKVLGDIFIKCKTPEDLSKGIDDPDGLISLLHICVGYANMFENPQAAHTALEMIRVIMGHGHQSSTISISSVLIMIGQSHLQLGNTEGAHTALCAAQSSIDPKASDKLVETQLALAFAEHFYAIQDFQMCVSYLDRARSVWESRAATQSISSHRTKLKEQMLLASSAHLTSQLAFRQGSLLQAAMCARQAVKVIAAVWLSISKCWQSLDPSAVDVKEDSGLQSMVAEFSRLDLSSNDARGHPIASAAIYWQETTLYCSTFNHMASILAHCGLYCDSVYFYEQGLKVAAKANMPSFSAYMQSELALLHAQAGQHDKAKILRMLHEPAPCAFISPLQRHTLINQAEVFFLQGDVQTALQLFERVKDDSMIPKKAVAPSQVKSKATSNLSRASSKRSVPKSRAQINPTEEPRAKTPMKGLEVTISQKILLDRLAVLGARLSLSTFGNNIVGLSTVNSGNAQENPRQTSFQALALVRSALKLFSNDSVNNVLAETAVALPVRYKSSRKSGRISFVQEIAGPDSSRKGSQRRGQASGAANKDGVVPEDGRALILKAHESLASLKTVDSWQVPSETVHSLHKLLSQTALLSSALGDSLVRSSVDILTDALSPLDLLRLREVIITSSEKATLGNAATSNWPRIEGTVSSENNNTAASPELVMKLDLLPDSWSVVSIGLTEDRTELLVARMSRQRSPFVLRIPLTRPDPSEMDHEELDFDSAKAELGDIVVQANTSAHDSRGSSADKATRKAWFAERQSLDGRLASLLDNIENVWFGGFRGLFSTTGTDDKALAVFGQSLSNTLNRHLPSRQKSSKAGKSVKVQLHSHVLELFLTLGHPRESDLEDSVVDLIYFVVDVLQFNGENNAYDEIDFDAMLVEVLDALHAYHEAASNKTPHLQNSHLILVMDKELQAFPWESLPCMRGESVSRMPSLGTIWERLEKMGPPQGDRPGHIISPCEGTYILNPSSDLASTEDTFKSVFEEQLPGFKAIIDRPPSETEFETALQEDSLVLYFGHGGGAQYIRGRTIRKLEQCAVTLLMGCSSVKLSECGVYESYGMPWNYINGGSAAVVGTLWDVTDRDIDRFAMEMMSSWGLVNKAEANNVKDGKNRAPKHRSTDDATQNSVKMSLDQAVARSRDVCLLKYLNGAAPVMYGIPVFLE
ncbi:hypothetical protein LTR84_006026 [Exophiala bonariae]|uniref:separase n=1 Tax=Exophiala bonariae TaxID=1690606 RepID=A0AAV9N6P8_9EURO|nr:hypothetical protein LTR84_006026 [Exophiala bonariae]